ncbi:hypothetical protein C1H46_041752 [Malus baccata]|uniref:Uncharacterized protein n=1 Tax=Malus baccata TaxID=106549 RepID=A0A540KEQ7_MALBA|nr:hypothetical protein C1H46_041752 [Malus baccata]
MNRFLGQWLVFSSLVITLEFYGFQWDKSNYMEQGQSTEKRDQTFLYMPCNCFLPLTGRVKDNKFIDCNDEGIPFVEAQVLNCTLSDVLKNPNLAQLNKFFPFELENYHNEIPGGVQLNMFQCGGFAIGQCVSHKLADGLSNFVFTNTWAATVRGDQADIDPPQFVSAALFPPPKEFNLGSGGSMPLTKDKVTRRYICNASEIETLRAKYQRNTKNVTSKRPSRVETLTAFIWNRFVGLQRVALRINCTVWSRL